MENNLNFEDFKNWYDNSDFCIHERSRCIGEIVCTLSHLDLPCLYLMQGVIYTLSGDVHYNQDAYYRDIFDLLQNYLNHKSVTPC